jgi:hypothetical protein
MKGSKIEFLFVHVIFRDIFQHISYFKGAIVETILPIKIKNHQSIGKTEVPTIQFFPCITVIAKVRKY